MSTEIVILSRAIDFCEYPFAAVDCVFVNKHSNGTPVCDCKIAGGRLRGVLFFEDQARFLKRQLSLPVSMISQ
jgi:hypothetical protein